MNPVINVFAYGSNMCTERLRARAASARPVAIGYVTHRRLAFHKRGVDGSAKANAVYTGCVSDRVWGVVFSIKSVEQPLLDESEFAYDMEQVVVVGNGGVVAAGIYVAQTDVIDESLTPYFWYHRLVIEGAREHRLPRDYVKRLQAIDSVADPDTARSRRHLKLLDA